MHRVCSLDYSLMYLCLQLRMLRRGPRSNADVEGKGFEDVVIELDDFTSRAAQLDITRLDSFFESELFTRNGFTIDHPTRSIIQRL
jgi:hypothetical protein